MSLTLSCCLCCTSCRVYKSLQNDEGECNEIYEITVKYFDPMLLAGYINVKCSNESMILCQDCWLHIKDFNDFQQMVIRTRSLQEEIDVKQMPLQIKLEEELITEVKNKNDNDKFSGESNEELTNLEDMLIKNDAEDDQESFGDTAAAVISEENVDKTDEDEMPLHKLRKLHKETKEKCATENQKTRLRKSKTKITIKIKRNTDNAKGDKEAQASEKPLRKNEKLKDSNKTKTGPRVLPTLEENRELDEFIAQWKPILECDICHETFPYFNLLKEHFKEKHMTRCYVKCCERKFDRRSSLVDHIRLHINPEIFKCDICGKSSTTKHNLKLHKRTLHEQTEQLKCKVCHRSFNQKATLERHMTTHATGSKDFICKECGNGYVLEAQLKCHIKSVHCDKHVCDQCGKTLNGIGELKKHLMKHAGIERPKYPCDKCDTKFTSTSSLKRHNDAFHNDGTTLYICGICGKVAASAISLTNHKRFVHEMKNKHKCTYCDKAFKRPKTLREHIATHTGEDLYQCPHCPQTFKVNANMHHHRKKAHPVEWEEGRKNRIQSRKVDVKQITNQVVL